MFGLINYKSRVTRWQADLINWRKCSRSQAWEAEKWRKNISGFKFPTNLQYAYGWVYLSRWSWIQEIQIYILGKNDWISEKSSNFWRETGAQRYSAGYVRGLLLLSGIVCSCWETQSNLQTFQSCQSQRTKLLFSENSLQRQVGEHWLGWSSYIMEPRPMFCGFEKWWDMGHTFRESVGQTLHELCEDCWRIPKWGLAWLNGSSLLFIQHKIRYT